MPSAFGRRLGCRPTRRQVARRIIGFHLGEWTMRMRVVCTGILAYAAIGHPRPAVAQVDQQRAQQFFKEAQALCERDGGRLWGVSICARMVIGDARTQTFATSQPPPDAPRPKLIGLLKGPIQWGDTMW